MTKKILAILMALVLTFAMTTVALADGETPAEQYTNMETLTFKKEFKLLNTSSTKTVESPAATFSFAVSNGTVVEGDAETAPTVTVDDVTFAAGEADVNGTTKDIVIHLPNAESSKIGKYTYTITEVKPDVELPGVEYNVDNVSWTLTVYVLEENGHKVIAGVSVSNAENGEKLAQGAVGFKNTYAASDLTITKTVTGALGDKTKEFTVNVTLSSNENITPRAISGVTKVDGKAAEEGKSLTIPVDGQPHTITVTNGSLVNIDNIPSGVTYTVKEEDYSTDGYTTTYNGSESDNGATGAIAGTSDITVAIVNANAGEINTGISMDSIPYIVLLAVASFGIVALMMKKRYEA